MTQPLLGIGIACVVVVAILFLFWPSCRLKAERCPRCKSKRRTVLTGEWGGEENWHCHKCGQFWSMPYTAKGRK